uniref:Mitotic spindle organizing protein 2B n=1 Tax=Poecilia latipinna TaxID=48699 RepID=A0A3B3TT57_9TELE
MSQQAQQTGATAPDSPVMVVTSNVQKYAIKKKKVLSAEESELFELTQAAGITVDQEVFKIIVDLLKMNVAPQAVFQTLKAMCAGLRVTESSAESSHTASTTAAPAEVKEEESLVSGKSPKPAAAHHSASAPRSARVNTKIVVYGPQDASSAHSQGPLSFTSIWVFSSETAVIVIFTIQTQRLPHPIDCFEWKQFFVCVCACECAQAYLN